MLTFGQSLWLPTISYAQCCQYVANSSVEYRSVCVGQGSKRLAKKCRYVWNQTCKLFVKMQFPHTETKRQ